MHVEKYPDFESAVRAVRGQERKCIFVEKYKLKAGEYISWFFHPRAQKRIIIESGALLFAMGTEKEVIRCDKGREISAVHVPPGKEHALLAFSDVSFAVHKTEEDRAISCPGTDLKAEWGKKFLMAQQIARSNPLASGQNAR
jgi:quercetin dioxygenase-like cupin family protein